MDHDEVPVARERGELLRLPVRPAQGVGAALDMMGTFSEMRFPADAALGLKVGLHEGPAITINNDDRLDYFGQTVNIAARVQGLAAPGEIWLTEALYEARGVQDLLAERGYQRERKQASLKGVGAPATVYRCWLETRETGAS